jgi:hypothetical protein
LVYNIRLTPLDYRSFRAKSYHIAYLDPGEVSYKANCKRIAEAEDPSIASQSSSKAEANETKEFKNKWSMADSST